MVGLDEKIMKYAVKRAVKDIRKWIDYIYDLYTNNGSVDTKSGIILYGLLKAIYNRRFNILVHKLIKEEKIRLRDIFYVDKDSLTNDYIISLPGIFELEIWERERCYREGIESIRFGETNKLYISTYPISQSKGKNYILLKLRKEKGVYELDSVWYIFERKKSRVF